LSERFKNGQRIAENRYDILPSRAKDRLSPLLSLFEIASRDGMTNTSIAQLDELTSDVTILNDGKTDVGRCSCQRGVTNFPVDSFDRSRIFDYREKLRRLEMNGLHSSKVVHDEVDTRSISDRYKYLIVLAYWMTKSSITFSSSSKAN
jgi:hypothetical protein